MHASLVLHLQAKHQSLPDIRLKEDADQRAELQEHLMEMVEDYLNQIQLHLIPNHHPMDPLWEVGNG